MKSSLSAGAVAGLVGGIVAVTVVWIINPMVHSLDAAGVAQWLVEQIGLNIVWGAVFGGIYSKVYDAVPSKGVTKGLYYSLLIWLCFIGLYPITFFVILYWPTMNQFAYGWGVVGFFVRVFYGPVLGALYKK
jgi:hypothetical protein